MICPSCKYEYIAGVTQCSDCGVALVDALDPSPETPHNTGEIVSLWAGNDPRKYTAVKDALEQAGITTMNPDSGGYFIFPSMRSKMEIAVSTEDQERAEKVLAALGERHDFEELTPEELESLALPESDGIEREDDSSFALADADDWDDQEPATEVWKGDDGDFANTLMSCLRENGIPSHKIAEAGHWRLEVRPEREARAKEIVSEVVEARPPE